MTQTTVSHPAQAAIYAKGIGIYRGWIVERDQNMTDEWWMAGYSLASGVQFAGASLASVLRAIDSRES